MTLNVTDKFNYACIYTIDYFFIYVETIQRYIYIYISNNVIFTAVMAVNIFVGHFGCGDRDLGDGDDY